MLMMTSRRCWPFSFRKMWFCSERLNGARLMYLDVNFLEKDTVKLLGAQWDATNKKWFVPHNVEPSIFRKWMKKYLEVPHKEKQIVRSLGAQWDFRRKQWYITADMDHSTFEKWIVNSVTGSSVTPMSGFEKGTNARSGSQERNSRVVIFDIETTGLPVNSSFGKMHDFTDLEKYESCRIVQMSCMLCDRETLNPLETCNLIVKTDGFDIANSEFHGITVQRSLQEGLPFPVAAKQILSMFNLSSVLVAHNAVFDITTLKSELHRYGLQQQVDEVGQLNVFCSMITTKAIVNARTKSGRAKYPSLKELYNFAVGKDIENQHDAMHDVRNLQVALKAFYDDGIIKI